MNEILSKKIKVYGIVQGVGFRPTVDRHAHTAGILGSVSNKGPYVEILAQGTEKQIDTFLNLLENQPPVRAAILKIDVHNAEQPFHFTDFSIVESAKTKGEIFVSPDIAICDECKKELFDPRNRRYLHPFINCTSCGPRLTILDSLPYDRERTSMKKFPMCPQCSKEYHDPNSRRYDAQPVCCNDCGPEVYIVGHEKDLRGKDAITYARNMIAQGKICAIKGIGGFHLCCDATNEEAVERLRRLKKRPMKPFAVMMKDEETVRRECEFSKEQEKILNGHQKPILLLSKKNGGKLCEAIAPDNPSVGVMLPYAPIQLLIFSYPDGLTLPDCLVMTSGNVSGAPICKEDEEAVQELSPFTDCILSNNRPIRIRTDDSVMDFYHDEPYMIRRSRGYAPIPCMMSKEYHGKVLAIGGELKNTFCLGNGSLFYPSSYVGDLADLRTVHALEDSEKRMEELLECSPDIIACDQHPRYNATLTAQKLAKEKSVPMIKVQHHWAHIASCMAENDYEGKCIGISMDGTGYGSDGTIWGGEIMQCDYHQFERTGSVVPFLQIGGDVSSREGWRIAVSMIYGLEKKKDPDHARENTEEILRKLGIDEEGMKAQFVLYDRKINAVQSTSAGRLFDGVAAILGVRMRSTFEGEASNALMFRAMEEKNHPEIPEFALKEENDRILLPTDDLVAWIVKERITWLKEHSVKKDRYGAVDENVRMLALAFHASLARQCAQAAVLIRKETGLSTVALSGGCFQNRLLLELCEEGLKKENFKVLIHHLVPPNDGGIALGQAVIAMNAWQERKK